MLNENSEVITTSSKPVILVIIETIKWQRIISKTIYSLCNGLGYKVDYLVSFTDYSSVGMSWTWI